MPRRIETPGRAECHHIVDPAVVGGPQRLGIGLDQHRPDAPVGHHPPVRSRAVPRAAWRSGWPGRPGRHWRPPWYGRRCPHSCSPPRCTPMTLDCAIPSNQSSPSAPCGAIPTRTAALRRCARAAGRRRPGRAGHRPTGRPPRTSPGHGRPRSPARRPRRRRPGGLPAGPTPRIPAGRRRSAGRPAGAARPISGAGLAGFLGCRAGGKPVFRLGLRTPGSKVACRRPLAPRTSSLPLVVLAPPVCGRRRSLQHDSALTQNGRPRLFRPGRYVSEPRSPSCREGRPRLTPRCPGRHTPPARSAG